MGVHESNQGLCSALRRAFTSMKCEIKIADAGGIQSTFSTNDANGNSCKDILERLIARGCPLPQSAVPSAPVK